VLRRLVVLSSAVLLLAAPVGAQKDAAPTPTGMPVGVSLPMTLQVGVPQGAFAENVALAGGFGFGALYAIDEMLGVRADLGFQIYGAETRRIPLGAGALSLVDVDVTTTNAIISGSVGAQLGVPSRELTPYFGGAIGFGSFTTTTSASGSNSDAEPFATTTNLSDATLARSLYGGLYVPMRGRETVLDLGVRRTWHGRQVRYLTPGGITETASGEVILSPRESRADLLTVYVGLTLRGGPRPTPK